MIAMRTVRVIRPFVNGGRTYQAGEIIQVPEHALPALGEHAEVIDTTFEDRLSAQSAEYATFCLAHENTIEGGRCPIKHDRRDPITRCAWWQRPTRSRK